MFCEYIISNVNWISRQKKDAENLLIQKGVEQRKILETYRSSKEEDINKTCQDMKERLQTNHDLVIYHFETLLTEIVQISLFICYLTFNSNLNSIGLN